MQKGFVGVVVAYFLAIALGILAGIWENHYLMIVVQFTSTVFIRLFKEPLHKRWVICYN